MNQESLKRKKPGLRQGGKDNQSLHDDEEARPNSKRIKTKEQEITNTDKAIQNLVKEHARVKKRLEEVQAPDFLLNLKKNLKNVDQEIKDLQMMKKNLHVEQNRREKRLDRIIEQNEPEAMKQINDSTQRLSYLNEKLVELKEQLEKAEQLKQ